MGKRFYLSDKVNTGLLIPEKYHGLLGIDAPACEEIRKNKDVSPKNNGKVFSKLDLNRFVRAAALTVLFYSLVVLCNYAYGYIKDIELNKAVEEKFEIGFTDKEVSVQTDVLRPVPQYPISDENNSSSNRFLYPQIASIDGLKNLDETYEDFVYWLYVENTPISYAVMQSDDNDYYLRRNINGETNLSGTLFLDYRNESEMESGNNIIYGHNMQNGTMFGGLKKYEKEKYFKEHSMIYTYTPDSVTAWKIFSVYETTTDNYYIQTSFINQENYYEFITGLQKNSIHKNDVILDSSSTVLTLSTCHKYDYDNGRFVVHAVKMFTAPIS